MKKPLLLMLSFVLVFLIGGINSSFSQESDDANALKPQRKKGKSNVVYIDSYIFQPNIEDCFLVKVLFDVEDELGNPIDDAVITLNSIENVPGNYTFTGIEAGTYNYSVAKNGYINVSGEVTVTLASSEHNLNVTLALETYTITFAVSDEDEGEITDAIITFNGVENDPGNYIFESVVAGAYNYKVEKQGYVTIEEQFTVVGNTTIDVTLLLVTYTVTFAVSDEDEGEINDAIITFNGVENDPGNYIFEGIVAGTYDYKVEIEGYEIFEGQVDIVNQDITINVTLLGTSTPTNPIAQQWISIFPNPNSGQFTIELNLLPTESNVLISVIDPTGRLVHSVKENAQGKTFTKDLNLSFLSKGVYFIHVKGSQQTGVKKLIIN